MPRSTRNSSGRSARSRTNHDSIGSLGVPDHSTVSGSSEINARTGAVMTAEQSREYRESKGLCIHCGEVKTHEKKFKLTGPKMKPLNVPGVVVNGQCLRCFKESPSIKSSNNNYTSGARISGPIVHNVNNSRTVNNNSNKFRNTVAVTQRCSSTSSYSSCDRSEDGDSTRLSQSMSRSPGPLLRDSNRNFSIEDEDFLPISKIDIQSAGPEQQNNNNISHNDPANIASILEFMRRNPEESALVRSFAEIGRIASVPENRNLVFPDLQMIIKSVAIVEFHRSNADMLTEACRTLYEFANTDNADRKKRVGGYGAVTYSLSFMKALPNHPEVQTWGAKTIALLATEASVREVIYRSHGLDQLQTNIDHSTMTPDAIEHALHALEALIDPKNDSDKDRRLNKNVMENIITKTANAMQRYKASENVLEASLYLLDKIWERKDCNGLKAFKPTVRIITIGMKAHPNNVPLSTQSFLLLNKMVTQPPDSPMGAFVSPKGLIEYIKHCLSQTVDCETDSYFTLEEYFALHEQVVTLFRELLQQDRFGFQDYDEKEHCVASIVQLIYSYLSAEDMERAGQLIQTCVHIMGLSQRGSGSSSSPPNFNVLEMCLAGPLGQQEDLVFSVLHNLPSMVKSDEHAFELVRTKIIDAVNSTLEQHMTKYTVREQNHSSTKLTEEAIKTLECIGNYAVAAAALDESGVADTLCRYLHRLLSEDGSSASTVDKVLRVLSGLRYVLVGKGDEHPSNFTGDILEVVCNVMQRFPQNDAVQLDGCRILRGCLSEATLPLYQRNDEVSVVLFAASEASEQCVKTANMILQILYSV